MHCRVCGCRSDAPSHAVAAALLEDNLDAAFDAGLLEATPCLSCTAPCTARLLEARDDRRRALAARDRYRARTARLAQRTEQRKASRAEAQARPAALPPAAAAALARALARAGKEH